MLSFVGEQERCYCVCSERYNFSERPPGHAHTLEADCGLVQGACSETFCMLGAHEPSLKMFNNGLRDVLQ